MKQLIAQEVRQQIESDRLASAQSTSTSQPPTSSVPPPALDPKVKIFIVSTTLDVATAAGQTCSLTAGDIIERTTAIPSDGKVPISVMSSKSGDCSVDVTTNLDATTLQDMHNQFREQLSAGMEQLASNQGENGLPAGPPAGARHTDQTVAEKDAVALLQAQVQEADKAEADVTHGLDSLQ
jgi:hypothetical protein